MCLGAQPVVPVFLYLSEIKVDTGMNSKVQKYGKLSTYVPRRAHDPLDVALHFQQK